MSDSTVAALTLVGMVIGLVGTIVPIVPGLWLSWLMALLYGLWTHFGALGWGCFGVITVLAALGQYFAVVIPRRDAASEGLTVPEQLIAFVVAVIGAFVVPIIGLFVGFALAVFALRWRASGDRQAALASTKVVLKAMGRASIAQAACVIGMIVAWGVWWQFG